MNQEQVKNKLISIEEPAEDFTVIFSGKESKRVDGLYHPEQKEIIIHNKNFQDDNALIYTAIHEYAHHIHFCGPAAPVSCKAHTRTFRGIMHRLLSRAEELGIYSNLFETDERFINLTRRIRDDFLTANGRLMKDFGALLAQARDLCHETSTSFEDYVDRVLGLQHGSARNMLRINELDIKPEIGFENMRAVASIRDEEKRIMVQDALLAGMSPDMVFDNMTERTPREKPDRLQVLIDEKEKLEKSLEKLTARLAKIEREIQSII